MRVGILQKCIQSYYELLISLNNKLIAVCPDKNIHFASHKHALESLHYDVVCLLACVFVTFRRIVLSDSFLEEFCCGPKRKIPSPEVLTPASHEAKPSKMETSPSHSISHTGRDGQSMNSHTEATYRTESQQQAMEEPRRTPIKCILDLKKKTSNSIFGSKSQHAHYPTSPNQSQQSSAQGYPSNPGHEQQLPSDPGHVSLANSDSVLEAAVNSILEC